MYRLVSKVGRGAAAGGAVCVMCFASGALPALASGGPVASATYRFVAKLEIGDPGTIDARGCSGALIRPRVVVTAKDCLVSAAHPDPAGAGGLAITSRFADGTVIKAVNVLPDVAPGLTAVVLARPAQVGAVPLATVAAISGDSLTAAGFGRTKSEWIPDQPHTVVFTVQQAVGTSLDLVPDASAETALCKGDAGAPVVRALADGKVELVAVATAAFQKGCLGSADTSGDATAVPAVSLASLPAATTDLFDQLTLSPVDSGRVPVAAEGFGSSVATADFNKDGYLDVAVGAPTDKTGANRDVASGTVTVFMSGSNGPGTGSVLLQSAFGAADEAGDLFGSALATGDFNKDGFADLAIGTPGEQIGTIRAGAIAVFSGSPTGLANAKGFDQDDLGLTDVAGDQFGESLAAGDFNGDGATDLAIGIPGKTVGTAKSGQVAILKGASTGLNKSASWIVDQRATNGANENGDQFGAALAAGNVIGAKTGTVYSDLVVGAPGESPDADPQSGIVYVIPGSVKGPVSGAVDFTQTGNGGTNEAGDQFGAALATGDFGKDGWADVVVGIPGEAAGNLPQSGTLTIFPGGSSTVGTGYAIEERDFVGGANEAGDQFGTVFATGDINADGYADLVAGAPGKASGAGIAYTFLGGPLGSTRPEPLVPGLIIRQQDVYGTDEADDRFGGALAVGDLNKDGKADAVVGSPGEGAPGEPNAGIAITLSRMTGSK
jgi:hypothetical protein